MLSVDQGFVILRSKIGEYVEGLQIIKKVVEGTNWPNELTKLHRFFFMENSP